MPTKGQRTVRVDCCGERVTVQPARDGTDYFYVEVDDGETNAWVFVTRRQLERLHVGIGEALAATRRSRR